MKKLITLLGIFSCLSCSENLCEGKASCIAGPSGPFDTEKVNVSFRGGISIIQDGVTTESIAIDSVELKDFQKIYFEGGYFSNWVALEEGSEVDSILIYSGESVFSFSVSDDFPTEVGGYVFKAIQEDENVSLEFSKASQSFIDGVCNDVICID